MRFRAEPCKVSTALGQSSLTPLLHPIAWLAAIDIDAA
jgi:hypothetical protein